MTARDPESTGFVVPYPAEYRAFGADETSLGRLAAAAGGKILRDPRAVFLPDGLTFEGRERLPLWRWLLAAAMALLPIDIALRRLRVPLGRVAGGLGGTATRLFLYFRK